MKKTKINKKRLLKPKYKIDDIVALSFYEDLYPATQGKVVRAYIDKKKDQWKYVINLDTRSDTLEYIASQNKILYKLN